MQSYVAMGCSTRRLCASVLLGVALAAAPAFGANDREVEGVEFDGSTQSRGQSFVLHGAGFLRWKVLFKPYVMALYRGESTPPADVLGSGRPRRLEIEYFYDIPADGFREAASELLARNLSATELAEMRPQIDAFNALFRDVEAGDRYALTFVPGKGTELALNGAPLGNVEGDRFGDAVYLIWLGQDPVDTRLRDILLAGR